MPRRARTFVMALAGLVVGLFLAQPAHAQAKHAFVVGINAYKEIPTLKKAVNDARAVAAVFKEMGFKVTLVDENKADRLAFYEAWGAFVESVREGDIVAVYFSGHGFQIDGSNYLLPRDVPKAEHGVRVITAFGIDFGALADALERKKPRITLHILDACRDNPYKGNDGKKNAVGAAAGLAHAKEQKGTFVMYAAGANEQALDWLTENDPDPNSVYTRHLLPLLKMPGISLLQMAKRLQSSVAGDARARHFVRGLHVRHEQLPAYYDWIEGEYFLAGPGPGPIAQAPQTNMAPPPSPPSQVALLPGPPAPTSPPQQLPCDDAGFAEAHTANTKESFESYLPKAAPKCAAVTRLALRDLRDWDAIEKAAGLPQGAAKSTRMAKSTSGATAPGASSPGLRTQIQRYLSEDDYKPAPRKAGEATALLRRIETSERTASCSVYAPAAVKLGKESADQSCGFRGEEWDQALDIQQSWCMDAAHGPEKANERLKAREGELARCKRAKTDKADWDKVVALKPGVEASAAPVKKARSANPSDAAYVTALADYIKHYEPDGQFLDVAKKELSAATLRQREAACHVFATASVGLAARNADDPVCKLEGPAWDRNEPLQYKACMEFEDTKRDAELKQRTTTIDACTWARRNDEAWQAASAKRTIESVSNYLAEWEKGPHLNTASTLLKELCEPKWAEAKKGDKWAPLDLFAHGYCAPTERQSEAAKLLKALDKRHWAAATATPQSAKGYKDYLKSFDGENRGCNSDLVMRALNRSLADRPIGLPEQQARKYWTCGEHVDAAVKAIVDIETWDKVNAKGAGCQEIADYIQQANSELGGVGRFVKQAKDKLREAIKAEDAKSKGVAGRAKTKDPRERALEFMDLSDDETALQARDRLQKSKKGTRSSDEAIADARRRLLSLDIESDCKQHEHLLSDNSRHDNGAYLETFGVQKPVTRNPLTGAPILDPTASDEVSTTKIPQKRRPVDNTIRGPVPPSE